MLTRGKAEVGSDRLRLRKPLRLIDGGLEGQGDNWANTRHGHESGTDWIRTYKLKQHVMENYKLRSKCPARGK